MRDRGAGKNTARIRAARIRHKAKLNHLTTSLDESPRLTWSACVDTDFRCGSLDSCTASLDVLSLVLHCVATVRWDLIEAI